MCTTNLYREKLVGSMLGCTFKVLDSITQASSADQDGKTLVVYMDPSV